MLVFRWRLIVNRLLIQKNDVTNLFLFHIKKKCTNRDNICDFGKPAYFCARYRLFVIGYSLSVLRYDIQIHDL